MRTLIYMTIPAFFAISCAPATQSSGEAICDGTRAARADLAATLAVSQDDAAVKTGARLIVLIDKGCE